jgi:DNA-binding LacI/PurR family transcriptional regulator
MNESPGGRPKGAKPRYKAIADDIARGLTAGRWHVGRRMPSFRHFARTYKVSVKTIQRAFSQLKIDGRVQVRPKRSTLAALGDSQRPLLENAIAVVSPRTLADTWQGQFLNGILQGANTGYTLIIFQDDIRWRVEFPAGLDELPLCGILLLGSFHVVVLKRYETLKLPVVLLDQPGDEYNFHSVSIANYEAASDAVARLVKLGHQRIAFLGYIVPSLLSVDPDSKQRQAGFAAACRQYGLKECDYRIFVGGNSVAGHSIQELFHATPPITAVVTATNSLAQQTAITAKALGKQIPRDLSIVSFTSPPATSMNWSGPLIDQDEFGRAGVDILRRKPGTPEHIHLKLKWHEGDTVGPPPKQK